MSVSQILFREHPLDSTLKNIESIINDIDLEDYDENYEVLENIERIKYFISMTYDRIERTDSFLLSNQLLNKLDSSFQGILNEIRAFKSNKDVTNINNASSLLDPIIIHLADLIIPKDSTDVKTLMNSIRSYKRSIGQYQRRIEENKKKNLNNFNKVNTDLETLQSKISDQQGRIDQLTNELNTQFTNDQNQRTKESSASLLNFKNESNELLIAFKKDLEGIKSAGDESIKTIINDTKDQLDQIFDERTAEADDIITEINNKKDEAESLVGIITDTGMVGGYQRVANEEHKRAFWWKIVAALAMGGLIIFALVVFIYSAGEQLSFGQVTLRIFVATTFGIFAAYAALQADKHEKTERKNRKLELELASISPYIHGLPDDQRNEIKKEIALRLFGHSFDQENKKDVKTTGTALDLVRMALEALEAMAKK